MPEFPEVSRLLLLRRHEICHKAAACMYRACRLARLETLEGGEVAERRHVVLRRMPSLRTANVRNVGLLRKFLEQEATEGTENI